ncbi:hypothetical protein GXW82_14705 [Streptacidiphilus sp. 4-A2]|nr:hypothetical protein [Streptacidiphilus sp. 4-A2]
MAFDTLAIAVNLAVREIIAAGLWHAPGLARFLAGLALLQIGSFAMQFLVFLRTDVYAVMVVAFDCLDLTRVSRLLLLRRLGRLAAAQQRELDNADRRDLQIARWYQWLFAAGVVIGTVYLFAFVIPDAWRTISWTVTSIACRSPFGFRFWSPLLRVLALLPMAAPAFMAVRDRLAARSHRTGVVAAAGSRRGRHVA